MDWWSWGEWSRVKAIDGKYGIDGRGDAEVNTRAGPGGTLLWPKENRQELLPEYFMTICSRRVGMIGVAQESVFM